MPPTTRSMATAQQRRRRDVARKTPHHASNPFRLPSTRDMCQRCQNLNLDTVFRRPHGCAKGRKVGCITWYSDSCSLCRLLDKVFRIKRYQMKFKSGPVLRSYSTRCITRGRRGFPIIDTVMLSVTGDWNRAFLVPQPDGVNTVRILEPVVSFDLLKGWLRYCREHHTKSCAASYGAAASLSQISSFRLIDCETLSIVPGHHHPYAALSYVWGKPSHETASLSSDAISYQHLPNTILDAIAVTKGVGLGHLWVDRYCINQQDEAEVSEQTSKMDLVYQNARVTIIAAAGEDSRHGLPGIRPRQLRQPFAQVGEHLLVSTMDDPSDAIMRRSKWSTRGWTYQEGLLSRRRLIFTDDQVYYECSGMYSCEVLNLPIQDLHSEDGQRFRSRYCDGLNTGLFPHRFGHSIWEVTRRIEEYTKRSLSYPSDILRAFLGIFRALEECGKNIRHVMGVPVLPSSPEPKSLDKALLLPLWTPTMGFCLGLTWTVRKPLKRRTGFPSWSWTGWYGEVYWGHPGPTWQVTFGDDSVRIAVELEDGHVMPWGEFYESYSISTPRLSPRLHISAWTTPVRLWGHKYYDGVANAIVDLPCGQPSTTAHPTFFLSRSPEAIARKLKRRGSINFTVRITTDIKEVLSLRCMLVHIARRLTGKFDAIWFLVVGETEIPNLYERVGHGTLHFDLNSGGPERLASSWHSFQLR